MDEQVLVLLQQMVSNQEKQLEYLKTISDDIYAVRGSSQSLCQALNDWHEEVTQEKVQVAEEKAIQEQEQAEAAALEAEQPVEEPVPEYQEALTNLQASATDMQAKLDNIDKTFTALDTGQYIGQFESLQKETGEVSTTAQQTNSFLVVIGFGVFLIIGILLARAVWRKL